MIYPSRFIKAASAFWLAAFSVGLAGHTASGTSMTYRRLQYVEDCSECQLFHVTPTELFTIWGFQFNSAIAAGPCLDVQVWYYASNQTLTDQSTAVFSPDPDAGWIKICDGWTKSMGPSEITTIAEQDCVPLEIGPDDAPHTFHLKAVSCICSTGDQGYSKPCPDTCDIKGTSYRNMTGSYVNFQSEQCLMGTNFPTAAPQAPIDITPQNFNPPTMAPTVNELPVTNDITHLMAKGDSLSNPPSALSEADDSNPGDTLSIVPGSVFGDTCLFDIASDGTVSGADTLPAGVYICSFKVKDQKDGVSDPATYTITVIDAVDDTYHASVGIEITRNAFDNDSQNIELVSHSCDFISFNHIDGELKYNATTAGDYTCEYTVKHTGDTSGTPVMDTATILIRATYGPAAEDDSATGYPQEQLLGSVAPNDDGAAPLSFALDDPTCANAGVQIAVDGGFSATLPSGTYECKYIVTDSNGATDSAVLTLIINAPPDAVDDTYPIQGLYKPVVSSLYNNDSDPEGDDLTVLSIGVSSPDESTINPACDLYLNPSCRGTTIDLACGSITVDADGAFSFDPQGGVPCKDGDTATFTYKITDGYGNTDVATATFSPIENLDPIAVLDIFPVTGVATRNILANDYDGDCPYKDCPEVTLSLVSLVGCSDPLQVGPSTGCLISGACGDLRVIDYDGNVEYTPNGSGCPTPDVFSYCMTDNQGGTACAEFRFEVNNAPVAENDVYSIPTGGLVDGDVSISHQLFNNDYDPDWEENPRDDPDFDDQYSTIKVISVDGQPIDNSGTFAMGDGTLLVERGGGMTYTLPYGLQSTTTDEVTFTYTISDFFGGTDIATVTIGVRGTVDEPETLDPTSSPSSYPTEQDKTASPTRSPVSAAPVTSRPTAQPATPSYLIEVVGDNDGRYTGVCEDSGAVCSFAHELCGNQPCGGSIVGPSTYETISGGSVTYQFIPDSCYNEPTYDSSGMLNGHFDADWVDVNPGWPANGHTNDHKHTYDDNCDCTWVDYFTPTDFLPIQQSVPFVDGKDEDKYFKIIIINDNLNRRGLVAINNKLDTTDKSFLKNNPDSYIPVIQYVQTPVEDLPIYTIGDATPDCQGTNCNVIKLTELALGYHADAVTSGPYGIVPSATGSMKSNLPGLNGEWRTGALTIQLVAVQCNADGCFDDFILEPKLSNSTNQGNMGPVAPPADPADYENEIDPLGSQSKVYFEGTLFWHGGDESYICGDFDQVTGECFDQDARNAFYGWYDTLYGGAAAGSSSTAGDCAQELCCVIIDGAPVDQSPPPTFYTFKDINDDHTIAAIFAKQGKCPACSSAPTSSPTISAAPSISFPPSIAPTLSHAPTLSQAPSDAKATLDMGTDTERCFGWAFVANNCFYGKFGGGGSGDGDMGKWHDEDQSLPDSARTCNAAVTDTEQLAYFPATSGNACPNQAETKSRTDKSPTGDDVDKESTATGDSSAWRDSSTTPLMTGLDCLDIVFENKEICNNINSPGACDAADAGCDSEWYEMCGPTDKCHSTTPTLNGDSCESDTEVDCQYKDVADNKARYKVTIKVKEECNRCWLNTANLYYYDYTSTDAGKLDQTTHCPIPKDNDGRVDDQFELLAEKAESFSPLPKEVNFYLLYKYELLTASATLWCSGEGTDTTYGAFSNAHSGLYGNNDDGTYKTIIKDKQICGLYPTGGTQTTADCVEHIAV